VKLPAQAFGTYPFPSDYDVVRVATLNKTDLTGGNNKFYCIELHVSKDGAKFRLFSCYGRVGTPGVKEERIPTQNRPSLDAAFEALLKEKTSSRKGYVEVKMATTKVGSDHACAQILSDDVKKDKVKTATTDTAVDIKLHPTVSRLVARLYEEAGQAVRNQLSGTLKTTVENPLGTLTVGQIAQGKQILQDVQELLGRKPKLVDSIDGDLITLSNQFYSAIPQVMAHRPRPSEGQGPMDAWLKTMALNNATILDEKSELLDLLSDVEGMVGGFATTDIGRKYQEIGCEYEWVDPAEDSFKKVHHYVQSTRSDRHDWKASIKNLWRVNVKGQQDKHVATMKDIGNVKPLFHGSGPQNILGICKHGLLMRPPGVFVTGSMFGNGLYFADQSSKSEQYAFGRYGGGRGHGNTYFMFVADVALGRVKKYQDSQSHLSKPPSGYDSVQGEKGYSLLHNEFIIYSLKQHLLQYLIEFSTSRGY
jgi:poly [ADP-ribose] polymerase 2/3/4